MEEIGNLISRQGNMAQVIFTRHKSCKNCGICLQITEEEMQAEVVNDIGAEIGDNVLIGLEAETFLKAAFILYIIPLIFLFTGILGGNWISRYIYGGNRETLISILGGVILLGLSYILVKRFENNASGTKTYKPHVIKVVSKH